MLKFPQLATIDNFTVQKSSGALKLADRIELNTSLLAFYRSVDSGAAKYNMVGGMMDEFKDESGVNTSASLYELYDAVNDLYSPDYLSGIDSYTKLILQNNIADGQVKAIVFDGTGDYLTVPDSADWDFGTGNFTIELWARFAGLSVPFKFIEVGQSLSQGVKLTFATSTSIFDIYINNTRYQQAITAPTLGVWYHFAAVRSGSNLYHFINGIQQGTTLTNSSNITGSTTGVYIGRSNEYVGEYFNGWMKEIRVSNSARYTANFVPTTTLFTADSNTKLLIHAEEAIGATTFIDSETTPKTITTNGDCKINLTTPLMEAVFLDTEITAKTVTTVGAAKQIPYMFNKSAAFFNGTTDYVFIPDHADWDMGTGEFDFEFFVNHAVNTGTICYVEIGSYASSTGIQINITSQVFYVYIAGVAKFNSAWVPALNVWYHVRVKRTTGTGIQVYIDGVQLGSTVADSTSFGAVTLGVRIGMNVQANAPFKGWLKEFRISNVARANVVPTTQYTTDANTKLLMHFDTPATAPLSPAIAFDGTGDYLSVAHHADFLFGTGDFDIEFFVYFNNVSNYQTLITKDYTNAGGFLMQLSSAAYMKVWLSGNVRITSSAQDIVNTWYHYRLQRASSVVTLYRNNIFVGTYSGSDNINSTATLYIGEDPNGGQSVYDHNGYLKEIRISNIARTVVVPTAPYVADANTKLLIHGAEANGAVTFLDSETTPKTVTTTGDTKIKYVEDYRNTIFLDSETTPKYPYPVGLAKIDFVAPFGTGVGYFGGSGNYLTLVDSSEWDLTSPCTVEAWIKWQTVGNSGIIEHFASAGNSWRFEYDTGAFRFVTATGGSPTYLALYTWTPIANTWYHVQYVRNGSSNLLFVNGSLVVSNTDATAIVNVTGTLRIGYTQNDNYYLTGFLDNVRISNTARQTATFNPPSIEYQQTVYYNMTLQSVAVPTVTTPLSNRITVFEEDVDVITLNTDLKAYASRDNGTTWTQITLVDQGNYQSGKRILSGVADISAQPVASTYNEVYKLVSFNNKNFKLRGVGMNW